MQKREARSKASGDEHGEDQPRVTIAIALTAAERDRRGLEDLAALADEADRLLHESKERACEVEIARRELTDAPRELLYVRIARVASRELEEVARGRPPRTALELDARLAVDVEDDLDDVAAGAARGGDGLLDALAISPRPLRLRSPSASSSPATSSGRDR